MNMKKMLSLALAVFQIEAVERLHKLLHLPMLFIAQQQPVQ